MPKLLSVLALLAAIAFAASPLFTEPFTGFNPDQLPRPVDDPPIQPAGYAFSIWGVIYLWLIVGAAYGLLNRADAPEWHPMRAPLVLSLAIGAGWIPVALIAPLTSTILIVAMLVTALTALYRAPVSDAALAAAPVALYAGWLSAASVVATVTVTIAYTGLDARIISVIGLLVIAAIASAVVVTTHHPVPYAAAVIWALVGVIVASLGGGVTAIMGAAFGIAVALAYLTYRRLRSI